MDYVDFGNEEDRKAKEKKENVTADTPYDMNERLANCERIRQVRLF